MTTKKKRKNFVGFRLSEKADTDIIKDLSRFTDTTERMKEVYRLAMRVERGEVAVQSVMRPAPTPSKPRQPEKPLDWKQSIPAEPTVKTSKPPEERKKAIKANIIQGF